MNTIARLLDRAREAGKFKSDAELARALHVTRGSVSNWRNGVSLPDAVACARIADLSGEPLARVLGLVGEARAKTGDERAVWRRLGAAAAVVLATGMAALAPLPAAAGVAYDGPERCIMRT